MKVVFHLVDDCGTCIHNRVCGEKSVFVKEQQAVEEALKTVGLDHKMLTRLKGGCGYYYQIIQ